MSGPVDETATSDGAGEPSVEVEIDWVAGDRIGRYVLQDRLGRGGMGTVFRAEQLEPFRREVAAKIIQLGMDTEAMLGRFEAERQILALLDHPNVATILDAGSTPRGRPFFIMELVDGVRIDEYADQVRLAIGERIELFIQVLAGVEHAHQKGVIHRDLKPSNILVTEKDGQPVAKIIDFGIAKSMSPTHAADGTLTAAGDFVGTPKYMSPEQATLDSNELDVRTDVFSLGVVLYELLVGLPPFTEQRSEPDEPTRDSGHRTAEHPSKRLRSDARRLENILRARRLSWESLRRVFSGDLSNILLKATEADRTRRYRNVSEFADDLQRYLDGFPVLARPRSTVYALTKFAQRHRALIAAGVIVVLAMMGLAGLATVEYFRAERNAAAAGAAAAEARALQVAAEREARTAERVSEFLVNVFDMAAPGERADADLTVREALRRSLPEIEASLTDEPAVRARVLLAVAGVFSALDQVDDARPLLEEATRIARANGDRDLLFEVLLEQGAAERGVEDDRAEALLDEALAMQRNEGSRDTDLARALEGLARVYLAQDRNEDAVPLFEEALAIWEAEDPDSDGHLATLNGLAVAWNHHRMHRRTGLAYLEQVGEMHQRKYGRDHHRTANVYRNLASAQVMVGPLDDALENNAFAESIFLETVGAAHVETRLTRNWRGRILLSLGDFEAADALADEVLATVENPVVDPDGAWALHNKALARLGLGDHRAVLELLDQIGPDALGGIQAREAAMGKAFALTVLGRREEAIALLERTQEKLVRLHLAEVLWAEAMVNPPERERLCEDATVLLAHPGAQLGDRSEILVYGQHERIRRCAGEIELADELAAHMREERYVDLWALAASRL